MINDKLKNKLLQELEKSGNVYFACLKTNVHRSTYYRWKKENEGFKIKAEQAEHIGRENICDVAEQALMANIKERKMDAIKYLLGHNSPRYKNRQTSNVVILHKKDIPLKPQEINLTEVFQKIQQIGQKSDEGHSRPEIHPDDGGPESKTS